MGMTRPIPSKEKTAVLLDGTVKQNQISITFRSEERGEQKAGETRERRNVPDQQWEVLRVEQGNLGHSHFLENGNLIGEDVDEAKEDEGVGDEGRSGELLNVADHGEGWFTASCTGRRKSGRQRMKKSERSEREEREEREVGERTVSSAPSARQRLRKDSRRKITS